MINKKEKGFTLVELLAVIVILAIILVIAVPKVMDIINDSKISSLKTTTSLIASSAEKQYMQNKVLGKTDTIKCTDVVKLNGTQYGKCKVTFDENGKATVILNGKKGGKFDNVACQGDKSNVICQEGSISTLPVINCTYEGELTQGIEFVHGQYTYRYMQEGTYSGWSNIELDGWGVKLTDKDSTQPVTSEICTYINNKPVVSMSYMFYESQAESIDLGTINTSNVVNMSCMFELISTHELDLSNFDTSNVTNMMEMFYADMFDSLDLSNFDTSKVADMSGMFQSAVIEDLDISSFDTSNVVNMVMMFSYSIINNLDISNFDTSSVTDMGWMFERTNFKKLDLSNFDTSNVTKANCMFCFSEIEDLDISSFDTSNMTNMSLMFKEFKTEKLDLSGFDTSNVINMSEMFRGAEIEDLDISGFDISSVTSMSEMFRSARISTLDLSNISASSTTNMSSMFKFTRISTLDLSSFDISSVTNMTDIFYGAGKTLNAYARTQEDADKLNNTTNKPTSLNFIVADETIDLNVQNQSSEFVKVKVPDKVIGGKTVIELIPNQKTKTIKSFKLNGTLVEGNTFVAPSNGGTVNISDVALEDMYIIESNHNPYEPSLRRNEVFDEITFDGAESLNVELTHQMYCRTSLGVYLYDKNDNLISDKNYCSSSTLKTENIVVEGDTLRVKAYTDYEVTNYYGFKVTVTPNY